MAHENLELLVTEKDDFVTQYQASLRETLEAKDKLEKKFHMEKEELLKQVSAVIVSKEESEK